MIFDEIITGFRLSLGGAQAVYGVVPDLAAFGKAMGNGMPISAVVGRRAIMRWMEDIFFSGTFGGETLSLAAAIATIDKLEARDAPARFATIGAKVKAGVGAVLAEHGLDEAFRLVGGDWWPGIVATGDGRTDAITANSLLRQELVAEGLLMGATFNLCLAHDDDGVIAETLAAWARAAETVASALAEDDPAARLRGAPIRPVFQVRSPK